MLRYSLWSIEDDRVSVLRCPCQYIGALFLFLNSVDVASFFDPSIQCIVNSVLEQRKNAHKKFTVRLSKLLPTDGGCLTPLIDSMLCLWAALLLATGSTKKYLKH